MIYKRKIMEVLDRHKEAREALVLTGFRRVGKTVVMRQIYEQLETDNKIYLDLESPVNQKIFEEKNYDNIRLSLSGLGLDFGKRAYVFLDEIQNVRNLPSVVKYLYDHNDIKFYLTGSSSFYLKNYFSESMAGRKFVFELYPLDFEEFLWFVDEKIEVTAEYQRLAGYYKEFIRFGGLPGVVLAKTFEEKQLRLDDILGSYFQLDVKKLANFRDNQKLKDLLFLLPSRVGSKPEIGKLADSLGVSRPTVYEYLNFFEQTYLISLLRPLSGSKDVEIKSVPKVYFVDTGVLNRIAQVSAGQVFENKVYNQLFTRQIYKDKGDINYYQTKTGAEIDFVVNRKRAYEVKLTATRYHVASLAKIVRKLNIGQAEVVSLEKVRGNPEGVIYPFGLSI